jgi:hypothetical protein
LRKFENTKTPGEDGVNVELLKYTPQSFLNISIKFLNIVWNVVIYEKNGRWLVLSLFSKTGTRRTVATEFA